jgi:hypothetical protein
MKFEIKRVKNGLRLITEDPDQELVCQDDYDNEVECFAAFLRTVCDEYGPMTSRYDAKRIYIEVRPGDKHEDYCDPEEECEAEKHLDLKPEEKEFLKPKVNQNTCIHGRSKKQGCRACTEFNNLHKKNSYLATLLTQGIKVKIQYFAPHYCVNAPSGDTFAKFKTKSAAEDFIKRHGLGKCIG